MTTTIAPAPAPAPAVAPTAAAARPAAPARIPLQNRTPEQLRDGLTVKVRGAADDALAAARMIQDAAEYLAQRAGTTMGLTEVTLNDKSADRRGALGTATFIGTNGVFNLSTRSTAGLLDGINRLRATPFDAWSSSEQQAFVQSSEVVLHEAAHVTLPGYTRDDVSDWRRATRSIEEGTATLATDVVLRDFMRDEFAIELSDETFNINRSVDAYTRYSERLQRLIDQAAGHDAAAADDLASRLANNSAADEREVVLAQALATGMGGEGVPAKVVDEIARTIPGFVDEKNGTRTRMMELQAWLVDHREGRNPDLAALQARLAEIDAATDGSGIVPPWLS